VIPALALVAALNVPALNIPPLPEIRRDPQVTYVDRSGEVLGVRGGRFGPPVDIARLPAYVPAAFVAIEDRRFYSHSGFDPVGIARAIVADLGKGRAAEGASTITQQLARNLFLTSDRTVERKADELLLAVQLEQKYSKRQILGLYLSRVYFGAGAYGIEAASERYFDKPASRLTVREAAMLAALMKSPTGYSPIDAPEKSAERTRLVLDAMVETGAITSAMRAHALAQDPKVWKAAPNAPAQYFVDWLDGETRRLTGGKLTQDLVVETTLDMPAEIEAAKAASATVERYRAQGVQQAALVSVDGAGRVRAFLGGLDYAQSPYDRAVDAHRQAGSSWKPFVYLTAMEAGQTPDTIAVDEPVTIDGWSPHDFEDGYLGPITLETALAQSINTVAARLADQVGRPAVAATARRLGISTPIDLTPAMALGSSLVTPIEMAQAYDAFANGGDRVAVYGIERIRAGGRVIYQHGPSDLGPAIANPPLGELDRMLRTVAASGTGAHAAIPGYDIAGKTGTTSDFKDAWFCGFTGGLTTVVWMGRDDNTPMQRITGGSAPVQLWRAFMISAMKRLPHGDIPLGRPAPQPLPLQTVAGATPGAVPAGQPAPAGASPALQAAQTPSAAIPN
jgi:penicillin-binding protein 1A